MSQPEIAGMASSMILSMKTSRYTSWQMWTCLSDKLCQHPWPCSASPANANGWLMAEMQTWFIGIQSVVLVSVSHVASSKSKIMKRPYRWWSMFSVKSIFILLVFWRHYSYCLWNKINSHANLWCWQSIHYRISTWQGIVRGCPEISCHEGATWSLVARPCQVAQNS